MMTPSIDSSSSDGIIDGINDVDIADGVPPPPKTTKLKMTLSIMGRIRSAGKTGNFASIEAMPSSGDGDGDDDDDVVVPDAIEKRHLRSVVDAISGTDVVRSDDDVPNIVEMRRLKTIASRGRAHDDDDIPDIVEMRDTVS